MRKTIFAVAYLLVAAQGVIAQESNKQRVKFGLHVAGGTSRLAVNFAYPETFILSNRPAMQFLGCAQARVNNIFFVSAESGLCVKGGVETNLNPPAEYVIEHTAIYGQVNTLFGAHITRRWQISGGAEFGVLFNHAPELFGLSPEPIELAGTLQVQYKIKERVGVGLRASRGITPYYSFELTDANGQSIGTSGYYHQALTAFARVQVGKGK